MKYPAALLLGLRQCALWDGFVALGDADNIFDGDACDFLEGFLGEEGLVCGDEDVGEVDEADEFIVENDGIGEVLKEDALFFFVDIECDAGYLLGFEGLDEGLGVDEFAAAGIDDKDAGAHLVEGIGIDEVMGFGQEGDV